MIALNLTSNALYFWWFFSIVCERIHHFYVIGLLSRSYIVLSLKIIPNLDLSGGLFNNRSLKTHFSETHLLSH
jgi:hypothetical protein